MRVVVQLSWYLCAACLPRQGFNGAVLFFVMPGSENRTESALHGNGRLFASEFIRETYFSGIVDTLSTWPKTASPRKTTSSHMESSKRASRHQRASRENSLYSPAVTAPQPLASDELVWSPYWSHRTHPQRRAVADIWSPSCSRCAHDVWAFLWSKA